MASRSEVEADGVVESVRLKPEELDQLDICGGADFNTPPQVRESSNGVSEGSTDGEERRSSQKVIADGRRGRIRPVRHMVAMFMAKKADQATC